MARRTPNFTALNNLGLSVEYFNELIHSQCSGEGDVDPSARRRQRGLQPSPGTPASTFSCTSTLGSTAPTKTRWSSPPSLRSDRYSPLFGLDSPTFLDEPERSLSSVKRYSFPVSPTCVVQATRFRFRSAIAHQINGAVGGLASATGDVKNGG